MFIITKFSMSLQVIKSLQSKEDNNEPLPITLSGTRTRGNNKRYCYNLCIRCITICSIEMSSIICFGMS